MNVRDKLESAFLVVIAAISDLPAGEELRKGMDALAQDGPCTVAWCKEAKENPTGTGNWDATVTVVRKGDGYAQDVEDPLAVHNAAVESVFGGLQVDDLGDQLSAAQAGFTAFFTESAGLDPEVMRMGFADHLSFRVYCCTSDIS